MENDLSYCSLGQLNTNNKLAIYELYINCFDDATLSRWSETGLNEILALDGVGALFCVSELEKLCGFVIWRGVGDESEILNIGVLPKHRQKGTGAELLKRAEREVKNTGGKKIFLEVGTSNASAIKLYEKCDYEQVGTRPNYYQRDGDGREDAKLMWKLL